MNSPSRFKAFIEAAIRKTKTGLLSWERAEARNFHSDYWSGYDPGRSFVCSYGAGRMLLAYEICSGNPHCFISPEKSLPFQRVVGSSDDKGDAVVLRLYNLVYGAFPSVDSFIDAMINAPDDPDDPPF